MGSQEYRRRGVQITFVLAVLVPSPRLPPADATDCVSVPLIVRTRDVMVQVYDGLSGDEAPLIGAEVALRGRGRDEPIARAKTDENGYLHVAAVKPGRYDLDVSMPGFMGFRLELEVVRDGPSRLLAVRLGHGSLCNTGGCAVTGRRGPLKKPPECLF